MQADGDENGDTLKVPINPGPVKAKLDEICIGLVDPLPADPKPADAGTSDRLELGGEMAWRNGRFAPGGCVMGKPFFLRAMDRCKSVKITPRDKLVFAYLATRQGDNGHAWPSERTMVRDLGVGRATLLRAIDNLCQAGLVAKTSGRPGRGHSNQYEVNLSKSAHGGGV